VHSEFTIFREAADSYYLVSAGGYQRLDHDWLRRHLPRDGTVEMENLTTAMGVLVVAGPRSRALLERVAGCDLTNAAFPWLTGEDTTIGLAPARLLRVNFVGELGWEIHHGIEYQNHIFDALMAAGHDMGLKPFGIRAMDAMRVEKSYRMVGTELSIEYAALESGLDRFVKPDKGEFVGRDGLLAWRERGFANAFATLEVSGHNDADPLGNNPITLDGELVGRTTSGNFGFRVGKSLALAMLRPDLAVPGNAFAVDVLGTPCTATIVPESPFDPENARLRA
jgi:dimethylglycine dehydrogenase